MASLNSFALWRPPEVLYLRWASLSQNLRTKDLNTLCLAFGDVASGDRLCCKHTSTLNTIVLCTAHVGDTVWAYVLHQLARKMYQCDVRQYASNYPSFDDLLSSFALAPQSTTALYSLERSLDVGASLRFECICESDPSMKTSFQ